MPQFPELSLSDMLSDPIVRDLMAADGVDPDELRAMLRAIAQSLRARTAENGQRLAPIARHGIP